MTEDSSIMVAVSLSDEEQEINTDDTIVDAETVKAIIADNLSSNENVANCEKETKDTSNTEKEADSETKIEALEQERGQLTAEVMSKDILITNLEKETSSLKSEVTQLETNHANILAEHERKFLLLSEEMSAKVAEVCISIVWFLKMKKKSWCYH